MPISEFSRRVRYLVDTWSGGVVLYAAQEAGIPQPTMQTIYVGAVDAPRKRTLEALTASYRVSRQWLLGLEGHTRRPDVRTWYPVPEEQLMAGEPNAHNGARLNPPDNIWMCRSCNADIFMALHWRTGHKMVFDAVPVGVEIEGAWCIKDGKAVIARTMSDQPRYLSHHATCPQANQWRKRKNPGGRRRGRT